MRFLTHVYHRTDDSAIGRRVGSTRPTFGKRKPAPPNDRSRDGFREGQAPPLRASCYQYAPPQTLIDVLIQGLISLKKLLCPDRQRSFFSVCVFIKGLRFGPVPQIEARRSGFDLERRSDGASERGCFQKETSPRTIRSPRRRGAGDGTRTRTVLPPRDFKSLVSTDSTTPAYCSRILPLFSPRVKEKRQAAERFPLPAFAYSSSNAPV